MGLGAFSQHLVGRTGKEPFGSGEVEGQPLRRAWVRDASARRMAPASLANEPIMIETHRSSPAESPPMIARRLALAGVLGAAAGGPYVASQAPDAFDDLWSPNSGSPSATSPTVEPAAAASHPPDLSAPGGPGSEIYSSPAPLAGPVGVSLEQALDWNVTRNWVYRNWARKSTGLADPALFGVRVPVVTGAGMTDLAGTLTYYFDRGGLLQRIRLEGKTADTSRLVHLATTRFAMQARRPLSPGDQLFQAVDGQRLRGELRTRPEGTLWATSPHTSFDVRMEVTRPGGEYAVTPERPRLELPEAPQVASNPQAPVPVGDPILPPRSVVPDRPATQPAPTAERASGSLAPTSASDSNPALPKLGSPTAAPPPAVKPLDGYRDRFRWPG